MLFMLFMGALLASIATAYGWPTAILVALVVAAFHRHRPKYRNVKPVPNQVKILELITSLQVERVSEEIVGTYRGNPIHSFIYAKYPGESRARQYFYNDIIQYNEWGQIEHRPEPDEVYTSSGLVYKAFTIQAPQPVYR